jgi:4-aminobutyrate aminotransferase
VNASRAGGYDRKRPFSDGGDAESIDVLHGEHMDAGVPHEIFLPLVEVAQSDERRVLRHDCWREAPDSRQFGRLWTEQRSKRHSVHVAGGRAGRRVHIPVCINPQQSYRQLAATRERGGGCDRSCGEAVIAAEHDWNRTGIERFERTLVDALAHASDLVDEFLVRIAVVLGFRNRDGHVSCVNYGMPKLCDFLSETGNAQRRRTHIDAAPVSTKIERHPDEVNGRRHAGTISGFKSVFPLQARNQKQKRKLEALMVPHIKVPPPGPRAAAILARDAKCISASYPRSAPFVMAKGSGAVVEDVDGNTYLDCCAGIATASTGHCHPEVVRAISEQAARFLHASTDYYHELQVELAEALAAIAPVGPKPRTFFCNSGTEAVEAAIKLARYHTKRQNIIAFLGSFHGRTLGSLALTSSRTVQRRGFGPMMPGVFHAPFANPYRPALGDGGARCADESLNFVETQILAHLVSPDEVAAIIVEPIQGEGGYVVPPPEFIQGLSRLTKRYGMLLIADEVQSGMGRTGKMFAVDHLDVKPDILVIAKAIASGLPMGLIVADETVMDWPVGAHSNTFGGNPVACAAALATIGLLRGGLTANAAEVGAYLIAQLTTLAERHRVIGDVRGKGLMIGIELVRDRETKERATTERDALVMAAFRRGLLILAAGQNSVRLSPPLVLTREQADTAVEILDQSLLEIAGAK